ncbi:MAG TPA: patatin-like phospholipase family protein, partial [Jatrophihabitans sp.]
GAGGALGAAWMVGALSVIEEQERIDCRRFDVMVGTSAGSVVTALLALGAGVAELADELDRDAETDLSGTGPVNAFDVHTSLARIPRPVLLPANLPLALRSAMGAGPRRLMTVAAGLAPRGRGDLAPLADLIAARNTDLAWPDRPMLRVVAMDYESGRRVVFGDPDAAAASVATAVTASCAAPGFFPPVVVAGHRYVDGGAVSMTNLDVLDDVADLDEVLVLAPMAGFARRANSTPAERIDRLLRARVTRRLQDEVRGICARGVRVRVLAPTQQDLQVMRYNVMNPARRRAVLASARQTTDVPTAVDEVTTAAR